MPERDSRDGHIGLLEEKIILKILCTTYNFVPSHDTSMYVFFSESNSTHNENEYEYVLSLAKY